MKIITIIKLTINDNQVESSLCPDVCNKMHIQMQVQQANLKVVLMKNDFAKYIQTPTHPHTHPLIRTCVKDGKLTVNSNTLCLS